LIFAGYSLFSPAGKWADQANRIVLTEDDLRYTNMNSTALCSPTRAAIITGRNHHDTGFGVIAELSTGYLVLRPRRHPCAA